MPKEKNRAMLIIIIALAICLIVVVTRFVSNKKDCSAHLESQSIDALQKENLMETIEVLQQDDIQRLIAYAKKVMAGEIIVERGESPLSIYSYHSYMKELFPTMATIDMSLTVVEAHVDGDRGELKVSYSMRYLDSSSALLMLSSSSLEFPSIWLIEKQGDEWVVVYIDEYP
jgi:predicted ribosome-associated RNA-binding protein Tma20